MKKTILTSSRRITLDLSEGALQWLPLHPFGTFFGNGITLTFDASSLESSLGNLPSTGLPLDYHHATVKVEEGLADKAPRAAQIMGLEVRDNYVYGLAEDWVQSALESVKAGEYGFISAVPYYNEQNKVVGYHSFALTNKPGTLDQRKIGLEAEEVNKMEELLKILGLPSDSSAEAARVALEQLQSKAAFADAISGILSLEAKNTPEARAKVMKLVALEQIGDKLDAARVALESQTTQAQAEKIEGLIKIALEQGRIFEPERVLWEGQFEKDFGAAKLALEAMPRRVPTAAVTPAADSSKKIALEENQAALNAILGVPAEAFAKFGGDL
jgi:phage I-like protein